jgi:radical SAM protein with 4Fe4S-binding SPASM domain
MPPRIGGCGFATVRVTPRATVQPCVYWPGGGQALAEVLACGEEIVNSHPFAQARALPRACEACEFRDACRGGCAGRRRPQGVLSEPDSYCPVVRGELRRLAVRMASGLDLPKSDSACTTIVVARD